MMVQEPGYGPRTPGGRGPGKKGAPNLTEAICNGI